MPKCTIAWGQSTDFRKPQNNGAKVWLWVEKVIHRQLWHILWESSWISSLPHAQEASHTLSLALVFASDMSQCKVGGIYPKCSGRSPRSIHLNWKYNKSRNSVAWKRIYLIHKSNLWYESYSIYIAKSHWIKFGGGEFSLIVLISDMCTSCLWLCMKQNTKIRQKL